MPPLAPVTVTRAALSPTAEGVKVTSRVQTAPGTRATAQLFLTAKSAAFVPERVAVIAPESVAAVAGTMTCKVVGPVVYPTVSEPRSPEDTRRPIPIGWQESLLLSVPTRSLHTKTLLGARPEPTMVMVTLAVPSVTAITVSYTHLRAHETRHDLVC